METLCTFTRPSILEQYSISPKRALLCHHKMHKERFRVEPVRSYRLQQKQGRGILSSSKEFGRRQLLVFPLLFELFMESSKDNTAKASNFTDMPALRGKDYGKTKMRYPDYIETESGLQYKDLRVGDGPIPKIGDTVVVDWDGYTIGYYGRIFEARNKSKGGSFEGNEKDYYKFQVGSKQVIPAFEESITSMSVGGIRRVIVPPELGYPNNDFNNAGPRPNTFSERKTRIIHPLLYKTSSLLSDIELSYVGTKGS